MPDSVNEQLQDRSIKHQTNNLRLQSHEANSNVKVVKKDIIPKVDKTLEDGLRKIKSRGPRAANTKALAALLKKVDKQLAVGFGGIYKSMVPELTGISQMETRFQVKMIEDVMPIDIKLNTIKVPASKDLVTKTWFDGRTTKEWYSSVASSASRNIELQVKQGISAGETVDQIMLRMRGERGVSKGVYNKITNDTDSVARTVTNGTNSESRRETYLANEDIIDKEIWVSTLDGRTTLICANLDGQTFALNEGQRPPAHMRCRSTTAPVVKSFKELGIPGLKELPPSTRASLNGQVPDKITYPEWLKKQDDKTQREVLGKEGAKLFREGKVTVSNFVDSNLKPLSLQDVKDREGIK